MILSKQNFPAIHPIGDISFAEPNSYVLKNGIKVFLFPGSKNDILSIDFLFDAGRWTENKPLIGKSCSALIKSGTHSKSAFEMSETIDFYGSTIKASLGYNTFSIQLYCLHRYLSESLPLLKETIMDVVFPASEVDLFKKNSLSQLKMNQEKTDNLADMPFKKLIIGTKIHKGLKNKEKIHRKYVFFLLIFIGIIVDLPYAFLDEYQVVSSGARSIIVELIIIAGLVLIIAGVVMRGTVVVEETECRVCISRMCVSQVPLVVMLTGVFFSSRRRHTSSSTVSWARRCV